MENYWNNKNDVKSNTTDNIKKAIATQSEYLEEITEGVVKGRFGIVKSLADVLTLTNAMSVLMKGRIDIESNSDDISPDFVDDSELIDIDILYKTNRYGYEIFNREYKYRLFSIYMGPEYPIKVQIENESLNETEKKDIKFEIDKDGFYIINNDKEFESMLESIIKSRKVRNIFSKLNN